MAIRLQPCTNGVHPPPPCHLAWSANIRSTSLRLCRDARVFGLKTTAIHGNESSLPPPPHSLHVTRRAPHGASCLVPAISAWSVKIRSALFRHSRDARVYGLTEYVYVSSGYPPPHPAPFPTVSLAGASSSSRQEQEAQTPASVITTLLPAVISNQRSERRHGSRECWMMEPVGVDTDKRPQQQQQQQQQQQRQQKHLLAYTRLT